MTSITNDDDNHLNLLSIKVADVNVEDKTLHAATDTTSATHPILDNQSSKPFPVNILLDTGSLRPYGNYVHKDIANSSYINITVMITKLVYITLKCFILSTTPFDFIIGRNTIKKHHLTKEI